MKEIVEILFVITVVAGAGWLYLKGLEFLDRMFGEYAESGTRLRRRPRGRLITIFGKNDEGGL